MRHLGKENKEKLHFLGFVEVSLRKNHHVFT